MLTAGTKLGAHEVIALVGAGGMGEVYRARDTRLDREVAVKVLPASFARDADALSRFEREARAVAALNHPNILSIFDFGTHDGTVYAVMELLDGRTLRQALEAGPLPPRRAVEIAIQIARGLAAAHGKGVVHRDLKPENVFLTDDGRVKILDFGLAKQLTPAAAETIASATPAGTEPGTVLGTVGYMSPEQVRGREVDARSDIFSFGAVFYEMLAGKRAFKGDSAVETMSAILKEEPPDLLESGRAIPGGLDRIVRHCLEKAPAARFQSASDIAFDLEALSSPSQSRAAIPSGARRLPWGAIATFIALPVLLAAGFWAGRRGTIATRPAFQQLTFQRGTVLAARFAPDGGTIVYGAAWAGRPYETFSVRAESQLARPFGVAGSVLAISSSGDLALSLGRHLISSFNSTGTLAVASLSGGAPREMLADVEWADWGPDGKTLAIVRRVQGADRLEYPPDHVLFQTAGWIQHPRVSPRADAVALIEHQSIAGDNGRLVILDLSGKVRAKSDRWVSVQGLAWAGGGDEVWFTATRTGGNRRLWALDLAGHERLLDEAPGVLTLLDVLRDRVLLSRDATRVGMVGELAGATREADLSYLDYSAPRDLSSDGRLLLFDEDAEGGGPTGSVYLLRVGDAAPVRLGDGNSMSLSVDGKWVLTLPHDGDHFVLLPTGIGQPVVLPAVPGTLLWCNLTPDGKSVLYAVSESGRPSRLFVQDIAGGKTHPISDEGVDILLYSHLISPDSRVVIARGPDARLRVYPLAGGAPQELRWIAADDQPLRWSDDGQSLFVYKPGEMPAHIDRVRLTDGHRERWKDLVPPDPAGVGFIRPPLITPDGAHYVYSYPRVLSELFLVTGIR